MMDEANEPVSMAPTDPVPAPTVRPTERAEPHYAGYGQAPALALFVGGFLTCLGLVLSVLALDGTIHPATSESARLVATPTASATAAAPSASPSATTLATMVPIVAPSVLTPTDLASGYSLGKAGANVTVELWEDFQCPYCRQFTEQVQPQLVATYVETGKARLVFRDFAFLGEESAWAAVAADLAEQQGKFWPYHDYLFANQLGENVGSFSVARLEAMAGVVGLNLTTFEGGLTPAAAGATYTKIQQAEQAEATKLGISGSPTIVVGGKVLTGNDWATVKAAVDAALAGK